MCNAHNHPPNCRCGWGGDGHKGKSTGNQTSSVYIPRSSGVDRNNQQTATRVNKSSFVSCNAVCPVCGASVYFYQSKDGGRVYFDSMGWPWPKHPCTDSSVKIPTDLDQWKMCGCGRSYIANFTSICPICVSERQEPDRIKTIKKDLRLISKRLLAERKRLRRYEGGYLRRMAIETYNLEIKRLNENWSELSILDPRYRFKVFIQYEKSHLTKP